MARTREVKGLASVLAWAGPLVLALTEGITEPLFRNDAARRSVLGSESVLQGAPSLELGRLFEILPIASRAGRAGLVAALAVGVAGHFVHRLALLSFERQGGTSKLDPWLALVASWSSVGASLWLVEGTLLGGAAPGAALALTLVVLGLDRTPSWWTEFAPPGARALARGILLGTLVAESAFAALAVVAVLLVAAERRSLRFTTTMRFATTMRFTTTLRLATTTWLGALATAALWFAPIVVDGPSLDVPTNGFGSFFPFSFGTWFQATGWLVLATAAFGLAVGVPRAEHRLAFVTVLLLDVALPGNEGALSPARSSLHLLALAVVSVLGALGLRSFAEGAVALRLFGARAAGALTVVLGLAAAAAGMESALAVARDVPRRATREFTDATLGALPARALVLLGSEALTDRFRTAQLESERPDVLLVPLARLGDVRFMRELLALEPRLDQLIRDLNVQGTPSEHALNLLVDERPVFVEADASWDRRLLEHVVPFPLLPAFSPHALGRSDRLAALDQALPAVRRLERILATDTVPDVDARRVVDERVECLAAALDKAGDHKVASTLRAIASPSAPPDETEHRASSVPPGAPARVNVSSL